MIEYFADAGPYEDAKEVYKEVMKAITFDRDKLIDIFSNALREVALQVERDTRAEIAQEVQDYLNSQDSQLASVVSLFIRRGKNDN